MKIKRRALWGYSPKSVEQTLAQLELDYRQRIDSLQLQIQEIQLKNDLLINEIHLLGPTKPEQGK